MPRFAPGTDAHDAYQERHFRRAAQRRQNIHDLLIGAGSIIQSMGAARRAREEQAANDLYSQRIQELMAGGGGGGGAGRAGPYDVKPPMSPLAGAAVSGGEDMVSLPPQQTPSFTDRLAADSGVSPDWRSRHATGGFFENLKNTLTFGTGAPRLKPDHMMALWQAHEGMRQRAAEAAWKADGRSYDRLRDTIEDAREDKKLRAETLKWASGQRQDMLKHESTQEGLNARAAAALKQKREETAAKGAGGGLTPMDRSRIREGFEGRIDKHLEKAAYIRGLKKVDIKDALINELLASDDEESREFGSFLGAVRSATTPEEAKRMLEERAKVHDGIVKKYREDPEYIAASMYSKNVMPGLIYQPQAISDYSPDVKQAALQLLADEGVDVDDPEFEQKYAEALGRAGGG